MSTTPSESDPRSPEASRRGFITTASVAVAAGGLIHGLHAAPTAAQQKKDIVVGVMGVSRGMSLAKTFSGLQDVRVKYLCDTDSIRLKAAQESLSGIVQHDVQTTGDFRRILDDAEVDALICAAPNHWHAPAAILACSAGKHCYVEKPCSHNPNEGELLVQAARKHKRCVQMGNQRR
ncbi:MAG: Gfo/Idh/MocA family oxidoreductase, partial [Planctomycetaceae bacterium]|nr:Gfo/Idh/MocA family oxidoreductase [Planctomycetaceae bacterium]